MQPKQGTIDYLASLKAIQKQNLVGYWSLDGHALDMTPKKGALEFTPLIGDANLVAYYKLEDVNDSKGSYTLTNNGTVTFSAGKFNNGADFGNSNTKYLSRTDTFGLTTSSNFTVSFWFKIISETNADEDLFDICWNGASGAMFRGLYEHNGGSRRIRFYRLGSSGTNFADVSGNYGDNTWRHCAVTYDGTNLKTYINAGTPGTATSTGTTNTSAATGVDIGDTRLSGYTAGLNGMIDDVSIFSRALSSSEIATIYTSGANGNIGGNNGTVTGALPVPSQNPAIPASLAYKFNGTSDYIAVPNISGIKSVGFWAYPTATSKSYFQVSSTIYISDTSGTLSATGFTSPSIYVDGKLSTTIRPNRWQFVVVTSGTAVNGSTMYIGRQNAGYLAGNQQEVSLWTSALSAQEIQAIYNQSKRKYVGMTAKIMGLLGTIYTLALAQGSFTLTGVASTFTKTLNMLMAVGTFTLTGIDALFTRARGILASAGTFTLTGIDLVLTSSRRMSLAVGDFTLTGIAALLEKIRGLRAEVGTFVLTGYNILKPQYWSNKSKTSSTWAGTINKISSIWTNKSKG